MPKTNENVVQETIPGCEVETAEQAQARHEAELRELTRKKIVLEGLLREIKEEEKRLQKSILACMRERKLPLIQQMYYWYRDLSDSKDAP